MARAEVASASVSSDSIKGLAQSIAKPAYRRLLTAEPALRRAVPALIIAFLVTICVGAIVQVLDHRRQAAGEVIKQIEATADFLVERLERLEQPRGDKPDRRLQTELERTMPPWTRAPGRQVLIANSDGVIVAGVGHELVTNPDGTMSASSAARGGDGRTPADRRARADAAADHVRRRRRSVGNSARRRQLGVWDGARTLVERRDRGRARARRCAGGVGGGHGFDRHAFRHHRLRGAHPGLRLPLAGDARARGRPDLRDGSLAHRYRAQPRPLRAVGLGSRPRPAVLVAFDVRDLGTQAARHAVELRRGERARPSRGYRSLRARRASSPTPRRPWSTTPFACAMPMAIGCGCAPGASWSSNPATAGRISSASPSTSPSRRPWWSAPSKPTCGCATPSRRFPRRSSSGTRRTAWYCAIRISRNFTTYRTMRSRPAPPTSRWWRPDASRSCVPRSRARVRARARAPSRLSSTTDAGCTSASGAPRMAAMSRSVPTSPTSSGTKKS